MYEDFIQAAQETDDVGTEHVLPAHFRECYPNLSLALCGKCGSKAAKTKPIPPASVSIRARDGGIAFTLTPQGSDRVLTGFILDPSSVLNEIEGMLENGGYSVQKAWKR